MSGKLAIKGNTEVAIPFDDIAGFENAGFEEVDKECISIPMIKLLQKGSDLVDQIEGARAGMFYNNVSDELYQELVAIPCYFRREYIEWVPRDQGGGLAGRHAVNDPIVKSANPGEKGKLILPDGHELVDTRCHYVLIIKKDSGDIEAAVLNMSSTAIKVSNRWNTIMRSMKVASQDGKAVTPPSFYCKYRIVSINESNNLGNWKNWKVEQLGPLTNAEKYVFEAAREFYESIVGGNVKVVEDDAAVTMEDQTGENMEDQAGEDGVPF